MVRGDVVTTFHEISPWGDQCCVIFYSMTEAYSTDAHFLPKSISLSLVAGLRKIFYTPKDRKALDERIPTLRAHGTFPNTSYNLLD